jgi:hypothetical protein
MSWQQWFLVCYFILNAFLGIALIGRTHKFTSGSAAFSLIQFSLLILVVVTA